LKAKTETIPSKHAARFQQQSTRFSIPPRGASFLATHAAYSSSSRGFSFAAASRKLPDLVKQALYFMRTYWLNSNKGTKCEIENRATRMLLAYLPGVPIMIELPDLKSQTRFNLDHWMEIAADPRLAKLPDRIETDRHGHILMTPLPGFPHSDRQGNIADLLKDLIPNGRTLAECPLSTADGVKAIDLAWLARGRAEFRERPLSSRAHPKSVSKCFRPPTPNGK